MRDEFKESWKLATNAACEFVATECGDTENEGLQIAAALRAYLDKQIASADTFADYIMGLTGSARKETE